MKVTVYYIDHDRLVGSTTIEDATSVEHAVGKFRNQFGLVEIIGLEDCTNPKGRIPLPFKHFNGGIRD